MKSPVYHTKAQLTKEKKIRFYQIYKLLCFKGYYPESTKKNHRMGEYVCKSYTENEHSSRIYK